MKHKGLALALVAPGATRGGGCGGRKAGERGSGGTKHPITGQEAPAPKENQTGTSCPNGGGGGGVKRSRSGHSEPSPPHQRCTMGLPPPSVRCFSPKGQGEGR